MTQIKMSKTNKEHYAIIMFNKKYDKLKAEEQNSVLNQYAREYGYLTKADEEMLMLEEEYGRSTVSKELGKLYR